MLVKEPDQRRSYKGYTKHPFYKQVERTFAYGAAVEGKKFGGYGLGTLCKWFHNEALGRDGEPATLTDLLDFMMWYVKETPGYHMPRERSRFVHWWGKWKTENPTIQSRATSEPVHVPVSRQYIADYEAAMKKKGVA
jgi:hypothetical protein